MGGFDTVCPLVCKWGNCPLCPGSAAYAVQVTTYMRRTHIVAVPLQAAQLVIMPRLPKRGH